MGDASLCAACSTHAYLVQRNRNGTESPLERALQILEECVVHHSPGSHWLPPSLSFSFSLLADTTLFHQRENLLQIQELLSSGTLYSPELGAFISSKAMDEETAKYIQSAVQASDTRVARRLPSFNAGTEAPGMRTIKEEEQKEQSGEISKSRECCHAPYVAGLPAHPLVELLRECGTQQTPYHGRQQH